MSIDYNSDQSAFIELIGSDARGFLQGQLSSDINALQPGQSILATANTPKGRMYGLFRLIVIEDGILMRCHASCLESILATLGKYKAFYKCSMSQRDQFQRYCWLDQDRAKLTSCFPELDNNLPSRGEVIQLPAGYLLNTGRFSDKYELWSTDRGEWETSAFSAWENRELEEGIAEIYKETTELFIPQMLNLDRLDAVSFNKGCYTGQEIIARMRYLGKLKKRMFLFKSEKLFKLRPGGHILNAQGDQAGQVVRCNNHQSGTLILAVCHIADIEAGNTFYADHNPDSVLTHIVLPE